MKKLITLFLAFSLLSCNDGNFDVPSFEFTDTVKHCGEYLLYITNSNNTEVLILTLGTAHIGSTAGDKSYPISSGLKVTYRIFEDGIGANYFCQAVPPSTPKVLKELNAESGTVNITTTETSKGYEYAITISNLSFNDSNDRIFFESLNFGIFTVNL